MGAEIPKQFWNGCSPKAVFRGSHSEISLEMGFPLHLSQKSQESLAQEKGFRHSVWVQNLQIWTEFQNLEKSTHKNIKIETWGSCNAHSYNSMHLLFV